MLTIYISHLDPFYVKEEFAPTDKSSITKRQQQVHDLIAPHFRLVQFLSSHFNATRLSNPHTGRIFFRLMRVTLAALRRSGSHPLAREVHFHLILLALRVISYGTGYDEKSRWELKDQILSAALRWFNFPARWSYGGNKLQVKAEVQVMSDVILAVQAVTSMGAKILPPLQPLQAKQDLLLHLLQNEITRLNVWLSPLGQETSHTSHQGKANDVSAPRSFVMSSTDLLGRNRCSSPDCLGRSTISCCTDGFQISLATYPESSSVIVGQLS